ncbi:MAG TPA: NAD(P)/FAD-dependent oxidoreductase [Cyclobacteriaceae bacterium]|jgi:phytoene dehydrogenase-like protein|nr:NAD(P)/FAD-dependent oxidoreductase [Cyclobacteriaceae bacterium]
MATKKYDVVIIGGGHNGLVAASYLAKAGKSVIVLEANAEIGGATASVRAFPDFDARLSRYSYLVSLLPDQIVKDLGLNFKTISRSVASYTPFNNQGLYVSRNWDDKTLASFNALHGGGSEADAWQKFYSEVSEFAQYIAPSLLKPLPTRSELKKEIGLSKVWDYLIENPIGEVITKTFSHDIVRGVVLTDALIGTFVSAFSIQANKCFLYHVIGNGTGEWKVPEGGMGKLVQELERVARASGVTIAVNSRATKVESGGKEVSVTLDDGNTYVGNYLLCNAAPAVLAKLRGVETPASLDGSQLKINMLLTQLPRLKSGVDPREAFAGTFHVNESFEQMELAYQQASAGKIPSPLPLELYCHTLTDQSILSEELQRKGYHTLTLFGLHTPASLFDHNHDEQRTLALNAAIASLNEYLVDPIESVLARSSTGEPAIEVKTPLDIERAIGLPRGNIFHQDLDFPFREDDDAPGWGVETDDARIFICGAGAKRGGGVSGISGHNAAMAVLAND